MPIKINSFGGYGVWLLRKYYSNLTSHVALSYADKKYQKIIRKYINYFNNMSLENSSHIPMFRIVNIETVNRCNGHCAFCPANVEEEKRPFKKMSDALFHKIIDELVNEHWNGQLFLNVNNEPFIDKSILKKCKMVKEALGEHVILSIITNGTLLTEEKLIELSKWCDVLCINNYSEHYTLNEYNYKIYLYVKNNPQYFEHMDIRINRRYSKEILATRAGNAPNKSEKNNGISSPCIYPFTDITIFPDGIVGLCCNDCFETTNFGDVNEQTLKGIWQGEKYTDVRLSMAKGRIHYPFCIKCDVSDSGFREKIIQEDNYMRNQNRKTDWTSYYRGKKSFFSTYTQQFTFDMLLSFFDDAASSFSNSAKKYSLMELGGGNSCFADNLCRKRNVSAYDVADNNELAVQLFQKKDLKAKVYHGYLQDLSKPMKPDQQYDFVFSIGLIEHFTGEDQKTVIQNHFRYCRDGGAVCISFPTPTGKYRFWRKVMEIFHVWHFWDEVPLKYEDIKDELEQYGKILRTELNKKLFLTQRMILIRKEGENGSHD